MRFVEDLASSHIAMDLAASECLSTSSRGWNDPRAETLGLYLVQPVYTKRAEIGSGPFSYKAGVDRTLQPINRLD